MSDENMTLWRSSPGDPAGKLMWVIPVEAEHVDREWDDQFGGSKGILVDVYLVPAPRNNEVAAEGEAVSDD